MLRLKTKEELLASGWIEDADGDYSHPNSNESIVTEMFEASKKLTLDNLNFIKNSNLKTINRNGWNWTEEMFTEEELPLDFMGFSAIEAKAFDAKRQSANKEILLHIAAAVEAYPSMRFGQILMTLDVVDTVQIPNGDLMWQNEAIFEPMNLVKRIRKAWGKLTL